MLGMVNVELFDFIEPEGREVRDGERSRHGIQVDLNLPASMENGISQGAKQQRPLNVRGNMWGMRLRGL